MEEMLLKMVESSPIMALLAIVLVIVFKMANKMITAFLSTLTIMGTNFEKLISEVVKQGILLEKVSQLIQDNQSQSEVVREHRAMEHKEIMKILERLNGE